MSDGSGAIRVGMYIALNGAGGLSEVTGWYHVIAPEGTAYPYGIFQLAAGGDTNETPLDMVDDDWTVKIVDTDAARAERLRGVVRSTLHNTSLTLGSGWIAWDCQHEGPVFLYNEQVANVQHYHAGSTFRIRAYASS